MPRDLLDVIRVYRRIMLPGPIDIVDDVMEAAAVKPISHRIPEFSELYTAITGMLDKLLGVEKGRGVTFLAPGSATLGLDMVYANTVTRDTRVLVVSSGFFAQRLRWMVERYSRSVDVLSVEPGYAPSYEEVARRIENGGYDVVTMVHTETSTGVTVRYISDVARVCRENNALFILDAVSSVGAEEVAVTRWGIDALVTAPQKAIGAPPGVAIVALGKRALEYIGEKRGWSVPYYYDIPMYIRYKEEHGWIPTTPPTNNMYALYRALKKITEYGVENYVELHRRRAEELYGYLEEKGLRVFPRQPEYRSRSVLVIEKENALGAAERIKKEHHVLVATGVADYADKLIRIGIMGFIDTDEVKRVIDILATI